MDKQEDALRAFGRRLAQLREQRDISVAELASRTGLDPRDIAGFESGEKDIPITVLFRLAAGLGVAPAQLIAPQ